MTITPESFSLRYPEFSCVTDERIQLFIDDAVIVLNEDYWGNKYDLGLSYLTAHYLTIALRMEDGNTEDAASTISAKAVDGTSITYAVPVINDGSDAFYNSTPYGMQYLALRRNLGVPAYVI